MYVDLYCNEIVVLHPTIKSGGEVRGFSLEMGIGGNLCRRAFSRRSGERHVKTC